MGGPNRCRVVDDDNDDCECECCCRGPRGRRGRPGGPQILVQDMLDYARQGDDVLSRFRVGTIVGNLFFVQIQNLAREVQNVTSIGENSFVANSDIVFTSLRSAVYQFNVFLRVVYRDALPPTANADLGVFTGVFPAITTQLNTSGRIPPGAVRTFDFDISGQVFFPSTNSSLFLAINQNFAPDDNPIEQIDGSISLQFIRYVDGIAAAATSTAPFAAPAIQIAL